jgi:hypothetical protein
MARAPSSVIRTGAFGLVEPSGFEPLTSCLQIMPIKPRIAADLGEHMSASNRC